ncbi:MAG: hypothetical protein AAF916_08605, partial [Planctomycetota bacterium]
TVDQYLDWLRRREHEQLANLIQANSPLSNALQELLSQQHDEVMEKLRGLDRVLSDVASHVLGFKAIADAVATESRISEQAVSILRQLNQSNASRFAEIKTLAGTSFRTWDGGRENIEITDERFIEDDLLSLCELGLLRLDYGSKGTRFFYITRAGARVGG